MKTILLIMATLISSTVMAKDTINPGDTVSVPGHQWVTVKNINPAENINNSFSFGESCSINEQGSVTAVAEKNDQVLVRYSTPYVTGGAQCPTDTIFFLSKEEFLGMDAEHNRIQAKKNQEQAWISQALGKEVKVGGY